MLVYTSALKYPAPSAWCRKCAEKEAVATSTKKVRGSRAKQKALKTKETLAMWVSPKTSCCWGREEGRAFARWGTTRSLQPLCKLLAPSPPPPRGCHNLQFENPCTDVFTQYDAFVSVQKLSALWQREAYLLYVHR